MSPPLDNYETVPDPSPTREQAMPLAAILTSEETIDTRGHGGHGSLDFSQTSPGHLNISASPIESVSGSSTHRNEPDVKGLFMPTTLEQSSMTIPSPPAESREVLHIDKEGRARYLLSPREDSSNSSQMSSASFEDVSTIPYESPAIRGIVRVYFERFHPAMPIVDKHEFYHLFTKQDQSPSFVQLVWAICTLAERFTAVAEWAARGTYSYRVITRLLEIQRFKPDLKSVQARLILSRYEEGNSIRGYSCKTWVDFGTTIRLAKLADLSRSDHIYSKQCWRLCFLVDACMALSTGLESSVPLSYVSVPDVDDLMDSAETNYHVNFTHYVQSVQLLARLGAAINDETDEIRDAILRDAEVFRAGLPADLQILHPQLVDHESHIVVQSSTALHIGLVLDAVEITTARNHSRLQEHRSIQTAQHMIFSVRDFIASTSVLEVYTVPRGFNLAVYCLVYATSVLYDNCKNEVTSSPLRANLFDGLAILQQIIPYSSSPWLSEAVSGLSDSLRDQNDIMWTEDNLGLGEDLWSQWIEFKHT